MPDPNDITVTLPRHIAHALMRAAEQGASMYRKSGENKQNPASGRAMALATADEVDEGIAIINKAIG